MARCHLLACPNETIIRIVDELFPEDLVSFILSNKAIHSVCQHVIRQHQAFLQQYSSIRFGPPEDCGDGDNFGGNHPLFLLEVILQNPKIAHYPIKLRVGDYGEDFEWVDDGWGDFPAGTISTWSSEIAALGTENQWLDGETRRQVWAEALVEPNGDVHRLAILLTMLPNLELIEIRNMSDAAGNPVREIVWAIAAANQDPASPVHERALINLVEISLDRSDTEYGEDITMYDPFTALPSVRFLHGRMIEGEDFRSESQRRKEWYEGPVPSQPGQIQDVNFMYSAIGVDAWEWMFKAIGNNLKRFAYYHVDALSDYSAPYDCAGTVAVLKKYASHSLRRLDLTAELGVSCIIDHHTTGPCIEAYNHQFVGDLKAFTTLRVLRLDDTAFQMSKEGAIARLIDVLPSSIRVLRLLREIKVGDPTDLFVRLAEGKRELLPELKRINLEGDYILRKGMVDECKAVGIEILGPCLQIVP
ncbi:MAG: hypothetical protein Q9178_007446 [Gyalolechia marmorata]